MKINKTKDGLFLCGDPIPDLVCSLTIVGSKRMTEYGKLVIESFVPIFVQRDIVIISGMAPGVEMHSMRVALKCGGRVLGVIAFGFDHLNKDNLDSRNFHELQKTAVETGGKLSVVSVFDHTFLPSHENFQKRNVYLSEITQRLLVVEASKRSGVFNLVDGVLGTAKPVYAVPGDVFSKFSKGANELIKQGSLLVTDPYTDL